MSLGTGGSEVDDLILPPDVDPEEVETGERTLRSPVTDNLYRVTAWVSLGDGRFRALRKEQIDAGEADYEFTRPDDVGRLSREELRDVIREYLRFHRDTRGVFVKSNHIHEALGAEVPMQKIAANMRVLNDRGAVEVHNSGGRTTYRITLVHEREV